MKSLILLLILSLLACPRLQAQVQNDRLLIEEYLLQSQKQKKTGLIMICSGTVAFGIGVLILNSSYGWDDPIAGSGVILTLGGVASTLIGIPILISSGSKARRAAELSLQAVRIPNPSIPNQQGKVIPSIGFSIPLNSKKP